MRRWLRLPKDAPLDFIHPRIQEGGIACVCVCGGSPKDKGNMEDKEGEIWIVRKQGVDMCLERFL